MLDLLEKFSIRDIITFLLLLFFAIKEGAECIEWIKGKFDKKHNQLSEEKKEKEDIDETIKKMQEDITTMAKSIESISNTVQILIDSDKDDIKAWITERHHFFCYTQKWIDDYSMDCLERRYQHYTDEKGNSFISGLMDEIRKLPKHP